MLIFAVNGGMIVIRPHTASMSIPAPHELTLISALAMTVHVIYFHTRFHNGMLTYLESSPSYGHVGCTDSELVELDCAIGKVEEQRVQHHGRDGSNCEYGHQAADQSLSKGAEAFGMTYGSADR